MEHRRIIKQGQVVLATREDGSIDPVSHASQGLFLADTRFLSRFQLLINGEEPMLMGSSEEIKFQSSYLLTNPRLDDIGERSVGLLQKNRITEGRVHIDIRVANWSIKPVEAELSIALDSDFFDSFEARGVKRMKRGRTLPPKVAKNEICIEYQGLDNVTRLTRIKTTPKMSRWRDQCACFQLKLKPGEHQNVELELRMEEQERRGVSVHPHPRVTEVTKPSWFEDAARIWVNNVRVQTIVDRSIDDLEVLLTEFPDAWVPAAGLPRFSSPYGRDCLITGLQTLMWNQHLARDVLRFLAHRQGKENNPWNYEQPGKIMHEMHTGELAKLNEVPFGLFYGSVDSTPLFLILGAEYLRWTTDRSFYQELEPHFDAAWRWIDEYGDIDGSGYIQYQAHTPPEKSEAALTVGLFNQGWKDSYNAITYADGKPVRKHPVALAEVQGQLYRALQLWSELYKCMPASEEAAKRSQELQERAERLQKRFLEDFWMRKRAYFATALDGDHHHANSITSNPGQCLWGRLIDDEHAEAVSRMLMSESMFTDWGIRTMANNEAAFNPFSYHRGSIWPYENAIIMAGLKKYGFVEETQRIFNALVDASLYFEYRRWPEVYAGVSRSVGGVLVRQPDASRPQAWSSGAIFLMLQTMLGIAARPFSKSVDITPVLPAGIDQILVENMSIGSCRLGLKVVREGNRVLLEIRDNPDDLDIVVHPATREHRHLVGETMPAVSQ